ncbi:MAG TPA: ATP-binding protein, partial [Rhodothermales bacterium]|nr:ATP-binding protein [Rhodothermales bacterium]
RFDPTGRLLRLTPGGQDQYMVVHSDRAGRLRAVVMNARVGTRPPRLVRLDPSSGGVLQTQDLGGYWLDMLQDDPDGSIWIGGEDGLRRFDPATRDVRRFPMRRVARAGVSDSLNGAGVRSILRDRSGTLWVGTYAGGLSRLDERTGRFTTYYDPVQGLESVFAIHEDRRRRLWLGTYESGLLLFDRRTGRFTRFGPEHGLNHEHVGAIVEDAAGMLWLNTPRGVSRFDPERRTFRSFGPGDGVPSVETPTDGLLTRAGRIVFGGTKGLLSFDPRELSGSASRPMLVLETVSFRLGRRDSTRSLFEGRRVDLPHDAADVTLAFSGLDYAHAAAVRYQYRLSDGDARGAGGWTDGGAQGIVRYPALPVGAHRFEVRAAGADGLWSAPQAVTLVVRPPWWRTWWAYGVYALLFGGLVFATDRVQRRRLVARERERAREQELQQAREIEKAYAQLKATQQQLVQQEKLASLGALTAGIAHEIKNPLNFVNNFAQLTEELADELVQERTVKPDLRIADVEDLIADLKSNAARIREHGQRADSIVKNMLAHSRGSTSTKEAVNLNALIDEYTNLAYHGMRAQRPDFTCTVERAFDPATGWVQAVPQDLSRVFLNLLSNAFYAVARRRADAGESYVPLVKVETRCIGDAIEASVWDNGGGIPETVRARIFEPFFTTKPAGEGTGLGLSLSHDIVAAHGGSLSVESETGAWTRFTVRLPTTAAVDTSQSAMRPEVQP